ETPNVRRALNNPALIGCPLGVGADGAIAATDGAWRDAATDVSALGAFLGGRSADGAGVRSTVGRPATGFFCAADVFHAAAQGIFQARLIERPIVGVRAAESSAGRSAARRAGRVDSARAAARWAWCFIRVAFVWQQTRTPSRTFDVVILLFIGIA